jgi:hypothetical protein
MIDVSRSSLVAESQTMTRVLFLLVALAIIAPVTLAQQLPPPRKPAVNEPEILPQGPVLIPPQNGPAPPPQNVAQQPPPGGGPNVAQTTKRNPGQLLDLYVARRKAEKDRKQAQKDRAQQFQAARAAEQQKLYQDWHERYLADTPVRVEYYRAVAAAYQSQPAYTPPYYYAAGPLVIVPPVYAPVVSTPVYYPLLNHGTFVVWGW